MLQVIRDRAQGIIVWTIVGLIIVAFATFGLSSYLAGTSKSVVATVNGIEISQNEYINAYQNYQNNLLRALGENYRPELFPEERMRKDVLEGLVTRNLTLQLVEDAGFHAAPQQVVQQLESIPPFKDEDGRFSAELYRQVLAQQGYTTDAFEADLARDIAIGQLRGGLRDSSFVTPGELERFGRLQRQQRDVGYLRLAAAGYDDAVSVSDEDVAAYYESRRSQFMTPETVSIEYVELDINDMAERYEVSEEDIRALYEQQRAAYTVTPEERKARHILIKVEGDTDEATARSRIEQAAQRLAAGEDFAEMARELSEDPGSAAQGGDLGFFGRGIMDKPFEDAAFALAAGETSEPVRSRFGYHLIRVDEIKAAEVQPLDEVRERIRHELQVRQAEQAFYADADKLSNLSFENPESLAPVAETLGLEILRSETFGRSGGAGIAVNPKVVTAAFSEEVVDKGRNSEVIELTDTHLVVLRMAEHQPAAERPLEEVRAQLVAHLRRDKARELAAADADAAAARLQAGEDPETVARGYPTASWTRAGLIPRRAEPAAEGQPAGVPEPVRQAAFTADRPQADAAVFETVTLANGDIAVVAMFAVQDAAPGHGEAAADGERLRRLYADNAYSRLLQEARARADISIRPADEE